MQGLELPEKVPVYLWSHDVRYCTSTYQLRHTILAIGNQTGDLGCTIGNARPNQLTWPYLKYATMSTAPSLSTLDAVRSICSRFVTLHPRSIRTTRSLCPVGVILPWSQANTNTVGPEHRTDYGVRCIRRSARDPPRYA